MSRAWILLVLAGCNAPWLWSAPVSDRAVDHIKIPHAEHAKAGVECIACHDAIWDAKSLETPTLPGEDKCLECHRAEKEKGNCAMCHTDVKRAAPFPTPEPSLHFDHAAHIERTKEKCEACHKLLPQPLRSAATRPTMDSCLQCHQHKQGFDQGRCATCHLDLTRYPLRPLALYSHQGDFVHEHPRAARATPEACAACHEQTFCADCHAKTVSTKIETKFPEGVDRWFIHRDDFLGRHSVEARWDGASCRRCHGSSFCEDCHAANNLTPLAQSPRDPHPPGWAMPGAGAEFHGAAARHDITSCAACHDQGARSICVDCHKVGGIGGNPHPPGWESRHGRNEIPNNNLCLTCHP
jgi:Cytochrome c7 and related cytochrome c